MNEELLRRATLKDCRFIFNLRNKDYVRKNLWDNSRLNYKKHRKWFKNNYKYYFIINEKQGCIRVNRKNKRDDIYIAIFKKYQKKGLGVNVIKNILKRYKNLTVQVKINNYPSRKMFLDCDFKEIGIILGDNTEDKEGCD